MRILYVAPGYKPAYRIGGPIISVAANAEMMARKGHQVIVFATNSNLDQDLDVPLNQPVCIGGVEVWYFRHHFPLRRILPFIGYFSKSLGYLYSPDMSRALNSMVPTVDLVHTQLPFIYPTYAASRAARRYGKPLFYHQRGAYDRNRMRFRALKKRIYLACIERSIMRSATTLVALTAEEEKNYRALGIKRPCRTIPNGIDTKSYRTIPTGNFVKQLGIKPDTLVVLFLGRLHPIKGADALLDAFLRLAPSDKNAVLVMAGPDEWGLEGKFRRKIAEVGAFGRVLFPGMVTGDEKLDLLARSDLFCLPSIGEGFSIATLEAMVSETPVMISPGCYFPEVVQAGAGWIVPPEPGPLAEALRKTLFDSQALKQAGANARRLVLTKYSWDTLTDQLIEAYVEGFSRFHKERRNESRPDLSPVRPTQGL